MAPDNKIVIELGTSMTDRDKRHISGLIDSFIQNASKNPKLRGKVLRLVMDDDAAPKIQIPATIFLRKLGVLETVIKYLHEEEGLNYDEIARALKRSKKNIVVSYIHSKKKHPLHLRKTRSNVKIPLDIFTENQTCFESICLYMRDTMGLSFTKIGKQLDRNEKTIWTVYHQAKLKENDA